MTPVVLSPEAVVYVRQRGGALTLRRSPRHGCCGGTVGVPTAEATTPSDPAGFAQYALDSPSGHVRLFVAPSLDASPGEPIRVGLDRFLGLSALYVEAVSARL